MKIKKNIYICSVARIFFFLQFEEYKNIFKKCDLLIFVLFFNYFYLEEGYKHLFLHTILY